jgi:choline dehydrogenase-like flavoprotein
VIAPSNAVTGSTDLRAAVCIAGAGAAGITLACELETLGVDVLLLDAGGPGWRGGVSQDPYRGSSAGAHPPPGHFRRRAFGGSTTLWGGRCVPYDPIDFETRSYVPGSGWPIAYDEVARHYPAALAYCDAGVAEFDPAAALPGAAPLLRGTAPPGGEALLCERIERYSLPTDFGRRYGRRLGRSSRVRVVSHAQVVRVLRSDDGGRIAALEFVARDGRHQRVRAQRFVLALGGIETVRLLWASDPSGTGYGNHSDCLGRYYTCHLENVIGTVRPAAAAPAPDFERTRDGVYARRKLQLGAAVQRRERLLNIAFRLHYPNVADAAHGSAVLSAVYLAKRALVPEYRRILVHGADAGDWPAHLRNVVAGAPSLARFGLRWMGRRVLARRKLPYVLVGNADGSYPIEFNAEQTPLPDSRITLGTERDAYGMPRVHVHWRCCEHDIESICRAYRVLRDGLAAQAGVALALDFDALPEQVRGSVPVGGHHLGGARMADTPARGVVDTDGAVFGLPNLYVAGAAVFPTSGHANPTLTITAMAIRLAHHLKVSLDE